MGHDMPRFVWYKSSTRFLRPDSRACAFLEVKVKRIQRNVKGTNSVKMKPFGVVRSMFKYTGYFENDQNPSNLPLNRVLNVIFWIGTWYYSLPALCFFLFAARSFLEYSDSFYFIVDGFLFVFIWPMFLTLRSKFIELIADYEELIEKRKDSVFR